MTDTNESETVVLLRLIAARLDALPALIATAQHSGSALSRKDRIGLEALLPELSQEFGSDTFVVRDVMKSAEQPGLRAAICCACGVFDRSISLRVGRLFSRADGLVVDGHRIDALNKSKNGVVWRVVRC